MAPGSIRVGTRFPHLDVDISWCHSVCSFSLSEFNFRCYWQVGYRILEDKRGSLLPAVRRFYSVFGIFDLPVIGNSRDSFLFILSDRKGKNRK